MTFAEKLRRLTADMNVSAVARRAGLNPVSVHEYLRSQVSEPRIGSAVRLAKALGIDAGWLIDDEKSWPPVRIESTEPAASPAA